MRSRLARLSLRARLTLWYSAAAGVALLVLGWAALVMLDRGLRQNLDASLVSVARTAAETTRQATVGSPLDEVLESVLGPHAALRFFRLLDPFGRPDPRLRRERQAPLLLSETALRNAERGVETFETLDLPAPTGSVRMLTYPVTDRGRLVHLVQVAMPMAAVDVARRGFLRILVLLSPLAVGGLALGGWLLTGRALARVDSMALAARRIGAEDLSHRIEAGERDDEIGRLAAVLNEMLERLERAFAGARRFSADAAHELRTPLTILAGEIDVALRAAGSEAEYRQALSSCREEVERMASLVEDLLLLARADAGVLEDALTTVDLSAVLDEAAPVLTTVAERGGSQLTIEPEASLRVRGSEPLLLRILINLLDNAVKHGGNGTRVHVRLKRVGRDAVLEVEDDGPGFPADERQRIFEPFYRADPARRRGGIGLGLSLVRSITVALNGRIEVESQPGRGSLFRVTFPLRDGTTTSRS